MTASRVIAAYAVLALFVSFYPAFFGELPVPATGALTLIPGGPPPPETNELSDIPTQFLPWSRAVADSYRAGQMPFRFDANGCGTPLWANPQAQAAAPTTALYLVLPEAWASAGSSAIRLILAASGAFVLFRAYGASVAAAGLGGFAFGFSLFFTTWLHFPHSYAHAWFPWLPWALGRIARGETGGFRAATIVTALLLLGGYPEGEFYVAVTGGVFFLLVLAGRKVSLREAASRIGRASAAILLAIGLTAIYTVPSAFAIAAGERSRMASLSAGVPRPPLAVGDFVKPPTYWYIARFWIVPEAQGNPRDGDKFGPYSFGGRASGYAGILVLTLGLATFFWRRSPREIRWCRLAVVGTALYVLWYPPLRSLLEGTPMLRDVALRLTTNRANGILVLGLAYLAARQLDRLREGRGRGATLAAAGIAFVALGLVWRELVATAGRPELTAPGAFRFGLPAILLVALVVALRTPHRGHALAAVLLVGTAVDLLRIGTRFNPGTRPEHYYPVTREVRELKAASRGGRFASAEATLTGMAYMYGLEDVRAHDPVALARYAEALVATASYTWESYAATVTRLDAPILDFANTRAILRGERTEVRASGKWATFPRRVVGLPDAGSVLRAMSGGTDFLDTAYSVRAGESFSGEARVLWWKRVRPGKVLVAVRTDSERLLAVSETNDGGWTAESDGARLPVGVVNHAFLGIRVPAGERTIVCRYVPPGFRPGAAISAVSLLIFATVVVWRRRRLRT